MDALKRKRAAFRSSFTKTVETLNEEIRKEESDCGLLKDKFCKLEISISKLRDLDDKILDLLLDNNCSDEILNNETETVESYNDEFITVQRLVNEKLCIKNDVEELQSSRSSSNSENNSKCYKLPKIELKKFDGELLNWLPFWAQFSKIHEDDSLHESDKFQYLIMSMQDNSRAKEFIESYPMCKENYSKAVDALKERFGNKSLFIEVYVRELLKLIICNINVCVKDKILCRNSVIN